VYGVAAFFCRFLGAFTFVTVVVVLVLLVLLIVPFGSSLILPVELLEPVDDELNKDDM